MNMLMRDGKGGREVEANFLLLLQPATTKSINANVYKQLARVPFYIFFKSNPFIPGFNMYLRRINS